MGAMLSAEPGQKNRKPVAIEGAPPSLAKAMVGCRFAARCPVARAECRVNKQELRILSDRLVRCDYAE
jgi:peptide/nickel transport system ATP-binding protein